MALCIVEDKKSTLFLPLFYKSRTHKVPENAPEDSPYCNYYNKSNIIVTYKGRESFFPEHTGLLSIKCAFNGQEFYESEDGLYSVDDSCYLILNEGERYYSYVSSLTEVDSLCIFLSKSFREDLLRSLTLSDNKLLDEPFCLPAGEINFFKKIFQYDNKIRQIILSLKESIDKGNLPLNEFEDKLYILLEHLIRNNSSINIEIEKIPLAKKSTKLEIYTRLNIAKDFIDASLQQKLILEDMAKAACLSPHHFLRLFKQFFGITPHQYIIKKRLERAKKILEISDIPVTEIALEVGFETTSHFSRLFTRTFGLSPRLFRKKR